jgi:hypothetical protein
MKEPERERHPDSICAERALKRAAMRAREIAFRTNTPIVIFKDGKIVRKWITEEDLKQPI